MAAQVTSVQQAILDIETYIRQNGGVYSAWYCGVATDPRQRLFRDHNVDEKSGTWIFRGLVSDTEARRVEAYFLAKGCKGGAGGGDASSRSVYCYRITPSTRQ